MTGFSELCLRNELRLPFSQRSPSPCRRRPATAITAGERSTDVRLGFHNCSNVAFETTSNENNYPPFSSSCNDNDQGQCAFTRLCVKNEKMQQPARLYYCDIKFVVFIGLPSFFETKFQLLPTTYFCQSKQYFSWHNSHIISVFTLANPLPAA